MKHVKKLSILFFVFFTYACNSDASGVQHINNETLKQLVQNDVPLVDVRTTTEWKKTGVVEGSHLLMFYDEQGKYNLNKWLADISAIASKDQPLILICHSGGRSKELANYLSIRVQCKERHRALDER